MVAWMMNPYLRLGQLLMNAGTTVLPTQDGSPDLFYIEDDQLARVVMKYSEDTCGSGSGTKSSG